MFVVLTSLLLDLMIFWQTSFAGTDSSITKAISLETDGYCGIGWYFTLPVLIFNNADKFNSTT